MAFIIENDVLIKYKGADEEVSLPEGITSIGDEAFRGCKSLTSIILPDGITSIGDSVFWDCTRLTSIAIPGSVTKIGRSAFFWVRTTQQYRDSHQRDKPWITLTFNNATSAIVYKGTSCETVNLTGGVCTVTLAVGEGAFVLPIR